MKSKLTVCISLFTFYILHFTLFAAVPQALTYRGVLRRTGGGEQRAEAMELTFRIYDSKVPQTALWARKMRVPVDKDGVVYAELTDTEGTDPDGIGRTLADAMGLIKGAPEIGLTPPDSNELMPRQRLSTGPRAARAARASAAKAAEEQQKTAPVQEQPVQQPGVSVGF